jgi:hypothetical protein
MGSLGLSLWGVKLPELEAGFRNSIYCGFKNEFMLWTVKAFSKFKFCCPTSWTQKETDVFKLSLSLEHTAVT